MTGVAVLTDTVGCPITVTVIVFEIGSVQLLELSAKSTLYEIVPISSPGTL